jgi:signal transduction histidine kinase
MVLQAGAVRSKLPPEPRVHHEALASIEQAGRFALAEMRRVLDATWDEAEESDALSPQPALADLPQLVAGVEHAGLPVHVRVDGKPVPLARGLDLSAYRIVQEALTNVLKHARATRANVRLAYTSEELVFEVSDDGRGRASDDGRGHGHGLAGIAERVKIRGGEMTAAPQPVGGFRLRARLPLAPDER